MHAARPPDSALPAGEDGRRSSACHQPKGRAISETVGDSSARPTTSIEIRLSRLQQLFNSFDPSPFHDHDLDQDAEDYIVDSADDCPLQTPLSLIVRLPADQLPPVQAPDLTQAIQNYFAYRLGERRRRLRLFFRDGRIALLIGLAFLFVCIVLRQVVLAVRPGAVSEIVTHGLLNVGWVAMWRPLEIFLYEWWPTRRRCRVFGKLSTIPVIVRVTAVAAFTICSRWSRPSSPAVAQALRAGPRGFRLRNHQLRLGVEDPRRSRSAAGAVSSTGFVWAAPRARRVRLFGRPRCEFRRAP